MRYENPWSCEFKYNFINKKYLVKDLPCFFAKLIEKYSEVELKSYEIKESQKWWHVSNINFDTFSYFYSYLGKV